MYNYWLGGRDNFAADRAAAELAIATNPGVVADVRANRAFLARVVRYLARECAIGQFLDIGTGLPTAGSTHEAAQDVAPDVRIIYVDNDPVVPAYARALLTSIPDGATRYLHADLRDTSAILTEAAKLTPTQAQTVIAAAILRHLHAVITTGQARDPLIAAHGSWHNLADLAA